MKAEQNELHHPHRPGHRLRRRCCAATGSRSRCSTSSTRALDPRMAQRPVKAVRAAGAGPGAVPRRAGPLRPARPRLPAPRRRPGLRPPRRRRPALPLPRLEVRRRRPLPRDAGRARRAPRCASACASAATRCVEQSGVLFAWLGPGRQHAAARCRAFDCFAAPATHSFAFKGLWHCNWLQAFEVGIDPAHPSFLHRYPAGRRRAGDGQPTAASSAPPASATVDGERWPMTRVMREFCQPEIRLETSAPTA